MLRKLLLLQTFIIASFSLVLAQTGKLSGKITDMETGESIPFANVTVNKGGVQKGGTVSDFDGNFSITPLVPGEYNVEVSYVGYAPKKITGVVINFEKTTRLDIRMNSESKVLEEDVIIYAEPLIDPDNTSTGSKLSSKEIEKIPTRNISSIATTQAGVTSSDDGGTINLRGARSDATQYFVNGVKLLPGQTPQVPVEAIAEVSILTGGIPAQYGDNVGGVISLTTKGPSSKIFGGIAGETSVPFDNYNYNLLNFNVSGPILQEKDSTGRALRTKLGYFLAAQYDGAADPDPPAIDIYRLKDEYQSQLEQNPLFIDEFGNTRYVSDTLTREQFETYDFEENENRHNVNVNATFDWQPSESILVSIGGNLRNSEYKEFNTRGVDPQRYKRLLNYDNNGDRLIRQYNVFARFTQRFKNDRSDEENTSLIKNAYYQVQVDYSRDIDKTYNKEFDESLFEYNYVGEYKRTTDTLTPTLFEQLNSLGIDPTQFGINTDGSFNGPVIYKNGDRDDDTVLVQANVPWIVYNTNADTYTFTGGNQNPITSRYTDFFFNRQALANDPITDLQQLNTSQGGLLNGQIPNTVHGGLFHNVGTPHRNYNLSVDEQFRVSALGVVELNNHSFKLGFEFEQRTQRQFNVSTTGIWNAARGAALSGTSLEGAFLNQAPNTFLDTILINGNPTIVPVLDFGSWGEKEQINDSVTVFNFGIRNQSNPNGTFHNRLRQEFGYANDYRINVDELDPKDLSLEYFNAEELLNPGGGGGNVVSYQGYNYYGERTNENSTFSDFFTDSLNRPIAAWRPNYGAVFIEDKFEIKDLILRLGVRVDRYDVNQPVLKDRYSLVDLRTVGESNMNAFNQGSFATPGNVGDDYVVYVDRNPDEYNGSNLGEFNVIGFRSGDQWFDAQGQTVLGASNLGNAGVFPWFDVTSFTGIKKEIYDEYKITEDAFEDYEPQINVMPRVSFSFPISEEALFFAHYDVLTQRPSRNNVFTSTYFYFQRAAGGRLNNPNLRPQRNVDYQVGFQQVLTRSSSLKLSTFYREMKDQISLIVIDGAYPVSSWETFGNIDFATSKGITVEYDLRRTNRLAINANYQLAFADGTSSGELSNARLIQSGVSANLRNPIPLNWDERHQIKINIDYRFRDNDGPGIMSKPIKDDEGNLLLDDEGMPKKSGGFKLLENLGVNLQLIATSGRPFTPRGGANPNPIYGGGNNEVVDGGVNGARLPWNLRSSLRVDKSIFFGGNESKKSLNVYVYVRNLLGLENIQGVYGWSGDPTNDGYLESKLGQQDINANLYPDSFSDIYRMAVQNPDNFALPRRIVLGAAFNF
ncbi:carboxypeptidase-like regulatory domain-containing protein [Hyphobacterium sp. CCMP332]|nr:carboxypeptidase-like regulatory domain-containing protein [Hyphobacterium sp. CCMP332]